MNKSKVNSQNPKLKNPISVFLNILSFKKKKTNMEADEEVHFEGGSGDRITFLRKVTEIEDGVEVEKTYLFSFNLSGNKDDDLADRLSCVFTMVLLGAFAVYTAFLQFIIHKSPIDCWCPAEFTDSHVEYVQNYCWISYTYYVPPSEGLSQNDEVRRRHLIKYYPWIPVILLLMALMFKLPNVLWRLISNSSGINLGHLARLASDTKEMTWDERQQSIEHTSVYIERWLQLHRKKENAFKNTLCGKRSGNYLPAIYIFVKCLYCLNVIGQFFLLDAVLGQHFYLNLGVDFFGRRRSEINQLGLVEFPRVAMCDFKIRQLSNVQSWTVQCVLPFNMFFESFFFILWFWYAFVAMVTCGSLILWLWRVFFPINKMLFIEKLLEINPDLRDKEMTKEKLRNKERFHKKKEFRRFVNEYLRQEGAFALRIVQRNSSDVYASDLTAKLWLRFINNFNDK